MLGSGVITLVFPDGIYLDKNVAVAEQIMLGILLIVAVLMAWMTSRLGLVDFGTALFGFSLGGMSGMAILARTKRHDPPLVAFLHMVRVFTLFVVVPLLARLYCYFCNISDGVK